MLVARNGLDWSLSIRGVELRETGGYENEGKNKE
jgi:hypothetical protein